MPLVVLPPHVGSNPCASCKALYGATCCEFKQGEGAQFPMTYGEAARIAKRTGRTVEKAVNFRRVSKAERQELAEGAGDGLASLVVDGEAIYLPRRENGDCVYLGKGGCTIPDFKPHVCAMFPFAKSRGRWAIGKVVTTHGFCLGQDAAAGSTPKALQIFGESKRNLDMIEKRWKKDQKLHTAHMRRRRRKK